MQKYIIKFVEGSTPGPFNVYLSGSGTLSLYAANVSKTQLSSGYIVEFADGIPSSSVVISNAAYGCATEENLPFPTLTPSITPSISVTPGATPSVSVSLTPGASVTPSVSFIPGASVTPSISITPSVTPSSTIGSSTTPTPTVSPSRTPSITPSISYKELKLSNPPGNDSVSATCAITSGLTYYYDSNWTITNGLVIYTNTSLTTRLYTSNPLAEGYYLWLQDVSTGSTYAVTFDSSGNVNTVSDCSAIPSPTPSISISVTPTPSPVPIYYYNATRCDDSMNYIVYGGNSYYGTGTVVISGLTSYCYTIQNEVGAQAYDDTVGASVDNCSNASCYVAP